MNQFYTDKNNRESFSRIDSMWRRAAYADLMRYKIGNTRAEREERADRLAENLGLTYFKRKDNDRCSIER